MVQGCSPSKICLCLPGSALAEEQDEPQGVMGQEGQPCWGNASPWAAPGLCWLHWPSCGHGTLRAPHQQPQQSPTPNSGSCLAPQGWRDAKGVGAKSSSPVALKLALTNALSKKLLQKLGLEGKRFFPLGSTFPSHCAEHQCMAHPKDHCCRNLFSLGLFLINNFTFTSYWYFFLFYSALMGSKIPT